MKDVIIFLEELGKNAELRLDRIDFESILNNQDFDFKTREAILNKDKKALELLLNARSKIVCMITPAEDDEDDEKDDEKDDEPSEEKAIFARLL